MPQVTGEDLFGESFDENVVTLVAAGTDAYKNVFGRVALMSDDSGQQFIDGKEIVCYFGELSTDRMSRTIHSAFKYIPVCENRKCLEILITGS